MVAMNELNVNLQHSILALSANAWSCRRIARELGINRGDGWASISVRLSQNRPFQPSAPNLIRIQTRPFDRRVGTGSPESLRTLTLNNLYMMRRLHVTSQPKALAPPLSGLIIPSSRTLSTCTGLIGYPRLADNVTHCVLTNADILGELGNERLTSW